MVHRVTVGNVKHLSDVNIDHLEEIFDAPTNGTRG